MRGVMVSVAEQPEEKGRAQRDDLVAARAFAAPERRQEMERRPPAQALPPRIEHPAQGEAVRIEGHRGERTTGARDRSGPLCPRRLVSSRRLHPHSEGRDAAKFRRPEPGPLGVRTAGNGGALLRRQRGSGFARRADTRKARPDHPAQGRRCRVLRVRLVRCGNRAGGPQGGGAALDAPVRGAVEQATGADLGGVRVHTGAASEEAAAGVSARAYTTGQDVHFGAGQYQPGSREGDRLIAHELVHTVQQRGSNGHAAAQHKPSVSQPGDAAELEADRIADAVVDGDAKAGSATVSASAASATLHRKDDAAPAAAAPPEVYKSWTKPQIIAIQKELIRLGLYRLTADGDLGQGSQGGLVEAFGGNEWKALAADKTLTRLHAAKAPTGAKGEHNLRYGEMFKDGVLDITLGIGFDEPSEYGEGRAHGDHSRNDRCLDRAWVQGGRWRRRGDLQAGWPRIAPGGLRHCSTSARTRSASSPPPAIRVRCTRWSGWSTTRTAPRGRRRPPRSRRECRTPMSPITPATPATARDPISIATCPSRSRGQAANGRRSRPTRCSRSGSPTRERPSGATPGRSSSGAWARRR
ncbi:MAG: DUF4157 domain-containing protein [Myxococcales bacterium]|nr:DUF4157 domain-containing protein [Myxococcales bacterium]